MAQTDCRTGALGRCGPGEDIVPHLPGVGRSARPRQPPPSPVRGLVTIPDRDSTCHAGRSCEHPASGHATREQAALKPCTAVIRGFSARRLARPLQRRHTGEKIRTGGGRGRPDLGTTCSWRPGAAADGPAPEGGTANSASAKVPRGRLAPRRPRTPTEEGIKRCGTCPGL